jgi:hypothetical protein
MRFEGIVERQERIQDATRRSLLKGAAALLAAGVAVRSPAAEGGGDAREIAGALVDDRMPAFWRVYDTTRTLPVAERAQRLVDGFFKPEQALYRRAGMKERTPDSVARWLAAFDGIAPAVRQVHAQMPGTLRSNIAKFRAALPDFDAASSPVFVLPSQFNFDAHLEPDGATMPLFFGPDGIVRLHGAGADLGVLFAHEIFHCYQGQRNPSMALDPKPPAFANLWIEGVATWASEQLNPGASLLHVLLDDETLLHEGPRTAPRVAAALLEHLDTTDDAFIGSLFTTGAHGPDWPARAGYYVGWLASRRIGRELTLGQMAALPTPQVRERLVAQLQEIRAGGVVSG